jgi:O-antigen biosynthesis protein WbqP
MYQLLKRCFDAAAALAALVILSPLLAAAALWVKAESPGPVLFRQERVGRNKRRFWILKFRTMRADAPRDVPTHLLQDPGRYITKAGAFLRRTSLDELPQLVNILRGEMSLVGPRPALWNQADLVAARDQQGANGLPPGLTGLAQISGRDELPICEKAALDGEYARTASFWLDLRILFKTAQIAFTGQGLREGADPHENPRHR